MSTDLSARIASHREALVDGFAKRYRCKKLVYYAACETPDEAYLLERQMKGWTRAKKIGLINYTNPSWKDLFEDLIRDCS